MKDISWAKSELCFIQMVSICLENSFQFVEKQKKISVCLPLGNKAHDFIAISTIESSSVDLLSKRLL